MSSENVVSVLQDIGRRCRDSEEGYRTAAQDTQDFDLRAQFQRLSQERAEMAEEIDRMLRQRGSEPAPREGSALGQAHRMFVDLKAALSGNDRQAVVAEVARGESAAEASYDKALRAELPEDVRRILKRQHDRVKETRDRYRAMSGSDQSMANRMSDAGQRSASYVQNYVQEQPMVSSAMAFGLGLALGILVMSLGGRSNSYSSSWNPRNRY